VIDVTSGQNAWEDVGEAKQGRSTTLMHLPA
jgi:hypothetical protein